MSNPAGNPAQPSADDRVREVLDNAMQQPPGARRAFVILECHDDAAVGDEVLSLLGAMVTAGDMLEPPAPAAGPPAEPLTGLEFGAYRVGSRIGIGGMGVVYEATDTRLNRTVAVKALPPRLSSDPSRRARFEQEARIVAALNHPNIASIHGIEQSRLGLVMVLEYVPGPTLADLLRQGPMAADDAMGIARQLASGLEAAHRAGVVHRDLKPANIKVTPDGIVKILDFGIAKLIVHNVIAETPSPGEPAIAAAVNTAAGIMVGTAAYMSPEQARGKPVDSRSDLWAFGCVLYEMLAGVRVFEGDTSWDAVAAILRSEPDWSRIPASTPQGVRRTLRRCLAKDPQHRLRDAGDALLDLTADADDAIPPPSGPVTQLRGARGVLAGAAIATLAAVLAFALWVALRGLPPGHTADQVRFSIQTSAAIPEAIGGSVALSPDGRLLAYTAADPLMQPQLFLRRLGAFAATPVPGSERASVPFFSPDGRWIGFWEAATDGTGGATLKRMPIDTADTGFVQTVAQYPTNNIIGSTWADDGSTVFVVSPGSLWRLPPGGPPVALCIPNDPEIEVLGQPEVLPGSRQVLLSCWRRDGEAWRPSIESLDVRTSLRTPLLSGASQPRYVRDLGTLCYAQGGLLMACKLNTAQLRLEEKPMKLIDLEGDPGTGVYNRYSVSTGGTLAFVPGDAPAPVTELAWFGVDRSSTTVFRSPLPIVTLRLSPDGRKVAFTTAQPQRDLWVLDLDRGAPTRFTSSGGVFFPVWTPDGSHIAYQHETDTGVHIELITADGGGRPERLYTQPNGAKCFPTSFSPDGTTLAISAEVVPGADTDIFLVSLDGDRTAKPLLASRADRVAARFSPDGTLVAYSSTETGRGEVYLHSFPSVERKIRVSLDGGERPTWSADGKRLFFRFGQRIYESQVSTSPTLTVGPPLILLDAVPGARYDPSPDGSRFIMGRPKGQWQPKTTINVVTNLVPVAAN